MLILGVILLLLGFFLHIQFLWILGIILAIIGAVLWITSLVTHNKVGGRNWY